MLLRDKARPARARAVDLSAARAAAATAVAAALAWLFASLSAVLQDLLLGVPAVRGALLRALRPRFCAVLDAAVRPPPLDPPSFDDLGYYVDPAAAQVLQFASLHALSAQLQARDDPLPPAVLLPTVSHVLLQTEEPRGGKYLENVAAVLAGQMQGAFLTVDALLLAALLAEALGDAPEAYLDLLRGGNGGSFGGGGLGASKRSSRRSQRAESRARLAWEALAAGLAAAQGPAVVFLRSADSLLCSTWEAYAAFMDVFGPKSGEALAAAHEPPPAPTPTGPDAPAAAAAAPSPVVLIAGTIMAETGAALVGGRPGHPSGGNGDGSGGDGGGRPGDLKSLFDDDDAGGLGGGQEDTGLAGLLLSLSRLAEEPRPDPRRLLPRAFPTRVKLAPPVAGPAVARHAAALQRDAETQTRSDNHLRASTVAAAAGVRVPPKLSDVYTATAGGPGGDALGREEWEKVLAWAVSIETVQQRSRAAVAAAGAAAAVDGGSEEEVVALLAAPRNPAGVSRLRRVASAAENAGAYYTEGITRETLFSPLPMAPLSPGAPPQAAAQRRRGWAGRGLALAGAVLTRLPGGAAALQVLKAVVSGLGVLPTAPEPKKTDVSDGLEAVPSAAAPAATGPLELSEASLRYGLAMLRRAGSAPRAAVQPENAYERQLLPDVLWPEDLGAGFSEVGALEEAKRALREAVQLPLQRPDLFEKGALARPPTGVLLFGPPGTGKTLLARATAAESGASFLELSLASLSSKWFGDSTKLVRAAFSLAAKLAPCVLFVDEVDALLGRRSSGGREHEATRELKNEFMARWDSIRGGGPGGGARVVVLGATNRPFDLDEAVLRRFSSRVAVGLPSKSARREILGVILAGQPLAGDVDLGAVADRSEGFSGADLRQLCVAAAMRPVRELVGDGRRPAPPQSPPALSDKESEPATPGSALSSRTELSGAVLGLLASPQMASALKEAATLAAGADAGGRAAPRPVGAADFEAARREVGPTVDPDSSVIQELKGWDSKFGSVGARGGEGGVGGWRRLGYYT